MSRAETSHPIRALVFDFDGLILDTEVPEFQSWQEIYAEHGARLDLEVWAHCIGSSDHGWDPYAHLGEACGRVIDREAIRAARRARVHELLESQPVLPGVEACLAEARGHGLGLAVASSSTRSWVEGHLTRLGLDGAFDVIRTSDDVRRTKPDPELYVSAVEALGVEPRDAIALEDSPNGIAAAREAGLFCVVVPNPLTRQLVVDGADLRLASLADMSLAELLHTAGRTVGRR